MRIYLCIALLLISHFCFAKINPSKRVIELSVEAQLNKNAIGRLTLSVDPNDNLSLKWSEIEPSFSTLLFAKNFDVLKSKVSNDMITQTDLEEFGCSVLFDLSDFSLVLSVPLALTKPQKLSLLSGTKRLQPTDPAKVSGFINAYSSYLHQHDEGDNKKDSSLAVRSEMVLGWNGWVLENEAEYLSDVTSSVPNVKRLGTRIIHDLPLQGMRLSIGDNYSSGTYFQSTSRILGLSIAHDLSLVSDRPIRPSASRSFTLESPSSVEVLVGDRAVQRLNLAAGMYSLDDIPLYEGNNNIALRITDVAGVVRYINFDVTTGLDLFAQGQLEYALHLGVPSQIDGELEYTFDEPLLSAYIDYGLTPSWTMGATMQADSFSQQIGFKNIYAARIGQLAFENALSFSEKIGYAYRFVYSNYNDNSGRSADFTVGYEYTSQDFTSLGYRPEAQPSFRFQEHFIQANYSFFTSLNDQMGIYASVSKAHGEDLFDKALGVNFSGNISDNWRYSLGSQWERITNKDQWDLRLSLSYKFSSSRRGRLFHQSRRDKTRLEFTQNSNQRYVGALNVRAGLERNEQNKAVLDFNTQYNANRFTMNVDHGSFYEQLNADSAYHQSRLSFASSIAFADTSWAIGKPIYDSFALVTPHSSLKDKKITLGQYKNQYRATNEDFETILLNDIGSYNSTSVTVDIDNLAPGYDIGSGMVTFFAPYRGGHAVTIGTEANISIIANLLNEQKKPLALQVGIAICTESSTKTEHTFFTNKKGRFALTGLAPCKYEITLKNAQQSKFIIDVVEGEQLQRQGDIYVQ